MQWATDSAAADTATDHFRIGMGAKIDDREERSIRLAQGDLPALDVNAG